MVNFLKWKDTNLYLSEVMNVGQLILSKYPIQRHWIKYEDLIEKPFEEVNKILEFLNLEWEESINNYRKNIKGRNINTPSYAEVGNKIHNKNTNRWQNYKKQTKSVELLWKV